MGGGVLGVFITFWRLTLSGMTSWRRPQRRCRRYGQAWQGLRVCRNCGRAVFSHAPDLHGAKNPSDQVPGVITSKPIVNVNVNVNDWLYCMHLYLKVLHVLKTCQHGLPGFCYRGRQGKPQIVLNDAMSRDQGYP